MKVKIAIPTMIALVAIVALAIPPIMAESGHGEYNHAKGMWADGDHHKKYHKVIQVTNFEGSLKITDDVDKHALKEQVTVSLSQAASAYPDAKKASMGIAVNENGEKFLVWKVIEKSYDHESQILTKTIHVIDAADADKTTTVTKQIDKAAKMQKMVKFKEVRQAFDSISEQDRQTIMSHFGEMKADFKDMTQEQKEAKHAEFKEQMEAFSELSLEEKISYLEYLAVSIRNQA